MSKLEARIGRMRHVCHSEEAGVDIIGRERASSLLFDKDAYWSSPVSSVPIAGPSTQVVYDTAASTFTCPLKDCRQQITFYGYLEEDMIRNHVFNECTSVKIHALISQSFDNGRKIKEDVRKPERLQCPLKNCKSRFSVPEKWIKHLIEKHLGPPVIT